MRSKNRILPPPILFILLLLTHIDGILSQWLPGDVLRSFLLASIRLLEKFNPRVDLLYQKAHGSKSNTDDSAIALIESYIENT